MGKVIDSFIRRRSEQVGRRISPLMHLRDELAWIRAELEKQEKRFKKILEGGRDNEED